MGGVQLHGLVFASMMSPVPKPKTSDANVKPRETEMTETGQRCTIPLTEQTEINQSVCEPVQTKVIESRCDRVRRAIGAACKPITLTPHYIIYLIAYFLIQTGHIVAFGMLPSLSRNLGISKTLGASLLSILGGTSGVARVLFGVVGDWKRMNRSVMAGTSGIISGLITCSMGYLNSYTALAVVTAVLGITSGRYLPLYTP